MHWKGGVFNYSRSGCSFEVNVRDVNTMAVTILTRKGYKAGITCLVYKYLCSRNVNLLWNGTTAFCL